MNSTLPKSTGPDHHQLQFHDYNVNYGGRTDDSQGVFVTNISPHRQSLRIRLQGSVNHPKIAAYDVKISYEGLIVPRPRIRIPVCVTTLPQISLGMIIWSNHTVKRNSSQSPYEYTSTLHC